MSLTFVNAVHANPFNGQISKSVTAGNHLFLFTVVSLAVDIAATGATDNHSNAWFRDVHGNSANRHLAILRARALSSGTCNIQLAVSGTLDSQLMELAEFSGELAASPFDVGSAVASGTGTALISNTITPTQDNCFLLGLGGVDFTGTVFTVDDPPWTDRTANLGERCHIASRDVTSIAAYSLTGGLSATESWGALVAAYKYPAAATGGPRVAGGATAGHRRNRLAA
jgi:hypothetical protein